MLLSRLRVPRIPGSRWISGPLTAPGSAGRWCRASGVRFENVPPVREFRFEKGLRNFAGWWYFATTGTHIGFESWLERDHLMLMDFDPAVAAVASQPFWLRWRDEGDRARRHAPDYFVRRQDGSAVVVDVRPDDRIPERDAATFAVTAAACESAGWEYRRSGDLDPVLVANVAVAVALPAPAVPGTCRSHRFSLTRSPAGGACSRARSWPETGCGPCRCCST